MNLILGKSKQEHANVSWEPFATSTPLKVVPNNGKIFHELKLLTQIGSVNYFGNSVKEPCTSDIFQGKLTQSKDSIPKNGKRNKSYGHFDLSSSDDDDPAENRRPVIKISSCKKTRCLLKTKKFESEESVNKIGEPVDSCIKLKSVESKENAVPENLDLKSEKGHTQNGNRKTKIASIKSNSTISCASSDGRSKIFDESRNNNLIRDTKSSSTLNNKRNELNNSKSELKLNEENDAKFCQKSKAKDMPKNLIKPRSKVSDNPQNKAENNKELRTLKRSTNNVINSIPVQISLNKNTKSKLSAQRNKCEATPLHVWVNKRNLSHQLFSDSREQEFISTLDLTSEEINEAVESEKYSLWQKQKEIPHQQVTFPLNGKNDNIPKIEEDGQERPKRRKQKPKEFWIPESESHKSFNNIKVDRKNHKKKNSKISTKTELNSKQKPLTELNDQPVLSEDINKNNPENAIKTSILSCSKPPKRGRRKIGKTQEKGKPNEHNDAVVTSSNDGKIKSDESNFVFNCSRTNAQTDRDLESNNLYVKNATAEEQSSTADITGSQRLQLSTECNGNSRDLPLDRIPLIHLFKQLKELQFKDNGMGCFATQCWHRNNLKCGVFKLVVNSQLSCITLHSNSHLGGVVVKGILKMKIGDKVLDLKEGDMAFVPPKTEWQATNIGDCESIFYYWCGRFNC